MRGEKTRVLPSKGCVVFKVLAELQGFKIKVSPSAFFVLLII